MDGFLLQATIFLIAAVIAVPVARQLGLGSVLGYLIAGVIIGPVLGLVNSEVSDLQHFAEFGVVLMLFLVGLELEPKALWTMRHKLLGLGGMQLFATTIALTIIFLIFGHPWTVALAVGLTFSLSSTAIVIQTLNEKNLMPTEGGRSAFSVLLSQDIAVIPMLAFVPLLVMPGIQNNYYGHSEDHASLSLISGLPAWGVTLVTIGAVALVIFSGTFLTRPVFKYVARSRLQEMFTAIALLFVVGIALLMTLVGLSPALGTFLAGVVLANSEFRHEMESHIEPFKGLLLGLFFITVGAGINFELLFSAGSEIAGLTLIVMIVKGVILYSLSRAFDMRERDKWLFTLSLAQAGEFGFVMLATTVRNNVIPLELADKLALVVALSMLATPLLYMLFELISKLLKPHDETGREEDHIDEQGKVIIVGIGRFGQVVNRMALATQIPTVVIDRKIDQIENMRKYGVKGFFGDPTRPELLKAAGLMQARVLIVAVDDPQAAVKLVSFARRARPDLHIIARAFDRTNVYHLFQAGASEIVRETFDSSLRAARYMLRELGWSSFDIEHASDRFFKADRASLEELAQLWDPNIPNVKNKKFVERAKEINKDFNTGFLADLSEIVDQDNETKKKS